MTWRTAAADVLDRLPPRARHLVPPELRAGLRHRLGRYHPWEDGADLTPPRCGPGETVGPPDFVGIGVVMSGAGRWYRLIVDHPAVSVRADIPMARHYLSQFATRSFDADQVERYHQWFPRRVGTISGEWTPGYSRLPWVAELLACAAPDARLLLMVRNPIERLRLGLMQTAASRVSQVGTNLADEVDAGFYGTGLRRVLEFFPADQILVLQYERCAADPAGQLDVTYRFLGVDPSQHRVRTPPAAPGRGAVLPALDVETVGRLVEVYADDVAELVSVAPSVDLSLWPEFGRR